MARTTTAIQVSVPAGAAGTTVTTGSGAWTWGAWVEFIASTATTIYISELVEHSSPGSVSVQCDVQIGTGTAGNEVGIGYFRYHVQNVGTDSFPRILPLSSPLAGIPAGTRVSLRSRQAATLSASGSYALVYFADDFDSDNIHTGLPAALPDAGSVSITPNAVAWAWSDWVEVSAALADSADCYGIAWNVASGPTQVDIEFEVGTGTAGGEVALTRFRTSKMENNTGRIHAIVRSAVCPLGAAGTRIALRLRKTGTNTTAILAALLTYGPSGVPSDQESLCGAETVYVWMELDTDAGTKYYAKENLALDDQFKEGRVLSFGSVRRAFSRDRGGYETATASIELSDTDRELRGLAATGTLLNKRCDIFAASAVGLRTGLTPRRMMQAIVRRYKPLPDLKFRLELEDFFGSQFSDFSGDRSIPRRLFTVDDFPNILNAADHPSSPGNPTLVGKPVPIGYGLLSDTDLYAESVGVVPAVFVGRRTVNAYDWDEYVLFGHAIKAIDQWFASASEDAYDLPRELMPDTTEGVDFLIPGYAGWATHVDTSDMYRDFNGNRYTVIYARGPRSDAAREGKVPFTFNLQAIEDVGDGTGDLIVSLPEQIQHLIVHWMLLNYTSGVWPAIPTIGTPALDRFLTTSTDTVKLASEQRITGGYLGAFMLAWNGAFQSVRDIIGDACRSCDIDIGLNKDGQLFMSMIDAGAAVVKAWGDVLDVLRGSFDIDRDFDRLTNRIEYRYKRMYIKPVTELVDVVASGGSPVAQVRLPDTLQEKTSEWIVDNQAQEDATSITNHGETRLYDLNLPMVRDEDTANDVVGQMLGRLKNGPVHATWDVDLCGTDIENGENQTLSEYQGMSATGWTNRLLRNEEHTTNLDALTVTLVARDLE